MDYNRRKNKRSDQEFPLEMLFGQSHYKGKTINISIDGALVVIEDTSNLPDPSMVGTNGKFWLILGPDLVEVECILMRVGGDRAAVQFVGLDFKDAMKIKAQIGDN